LGQQPPTPSTPILIFTPPTVPDNLNELAESCAGSAESVDDGSALRVPFGEADWGEVEMEGPAATLDAHELPERPQTPSPPVPPKDEVEEDWSPAIPISRDDSSYSIDEHAGHSKAIPLTGKVRKLSPAPWEMEFQVSGSSNSTTGSQDLYSPLSNVSTAKSSVFSEKGRMDDGYFDQLLKEEKTIKKSLNSPLMSELRNSISRESLNSVSEAGHSVVAEGDRPSQDLGAIVSAVPAETQKRGSKKNIKGLFINTSAAPTISAPVTSTPRSPNSRRYPPSPSVLTPGQFKSYDSISSSDALASPSLNGGMVISVDSPRRKGFGKLLNLISPTKKNFSNPAVGIEHQVMPSVLDVEGGGERSSQEDRKSNSGSILETRLSEEAEKEEEKMKGSKTFENLIGKYQTMEGAEKEVVKSVIDRM
ncbi:hypothetical protein BT69DRAFT_1302674, partial [Atractiella rhizophila]